MTDARRDETSTLRARLVEHAKACHEALDRGGDQPELPADLRDLRGVDLRRANLLGADLRGTDLRGANLLGADLRWADLRRADLRWANLRGANLWGANLRGANLLGANLCWADLHGTELLGANLRWADLRGADLRGADLRGADLRWADLRGADPRRANLRRANLRGANGVTRIEAARYPCWMIGPCLAYGCETHKISDWPLDKIEARHPNGVGEHAEVRSIIERLRAEAENSNTKEASND